MKIFVAGVSGAIGQPLIAELIRQGHQVTAMSLNKANTQKLADMGASAALVDAFDAVAVERALRRSEAEIVIDQLTALPKDTSGYAAAFPGDRKLRLEGGGNLFGAAQAVGVRRYIQQASGFFLKTDGGRTSSRGWRPMPALAWLRVQGCMPTWKRAFRIRARWKASLCVMGSFTV